METKYIVVEDPSGEPYMLVFSGALPHEKIGAVFKSNPVWPFVVVSAGFVNPETGQCYGKSVGLSLKANEKRDTAIAKRTLQIE